MTDAATDTPPPPATPTVVRGDIDGANCAECPFAVDGRPNHPVRGIGPEKPHFVIIGEGPGAEEVRRGLPFIGPTGQLLDRGLRETNVDRNLAWVTNATLCPPLGKLGKDPKVRKQAAKCCQPRLERELMERPDIPVLVLGDVAAATLLEGATTLPITKIAGAHFEVDVDGSGVRSIIPSVHPAAILRSSGDGDKGPEKTGSHVADLAYWSLKWDILKVKNLADGKDIRLRMRVGEELFIELKDSERARNLVWERLCAARDTGRLTIDYETYVDDPERNFALQAFVAKIRLIGLASAGKACCVAWDLLDPVMIDEYAKVLADKTITKCWHNGQVYDGAISQNQWYRFTINGPTEDTLLGQHVAWPGAPKGLQKVACQYRAIESWKAEFRDSGDSLEDEAVYCLHHSQGVVFADGSVRPIHHVVRQRLRGPVRTVLPNGDLGEALITDWHCARKVGQEWIEIRTELTHGRLRGLTVTPDHAVFTSRGRIIAERVRVGDEIIVDEPRLDAQTRSALLGTLLGDSSLCVSPVFRRRKWQAPRAGLQGGHAVRTKLVARKQRAIPFLRAATKAIPGRVKTIEGYRVTTTPFLPMFSPQMKQLRGLMPLLYQRNGRRKIDPRVLDQLGPVGWAWWFMDDGCRQNTTYGMDTVCLSIPRYSRRDQLRVRDWLRAKLGPSVNVYSDGVVRFGKPETLKFCRWIAPYVFDIARYKLPRGVRWPAWVDWRADLSKPLTAKVIAVRSVTQPRRRKDQRHRADTRWCITVPGPGRFFTPHGLVSNCAKDAFATDATIAPTLFWIKRYGVEKVYDVDKIKGAFATKMHLRGYYVDPDVNAEIKKRLKTVIDEANTFMDGRYREIADRVHAKLAAERAKTQRKKDPEFYADRIRVREAELAKEIEKGKFEFSASNDWHAAAFLKAAGVPLWATTKGGRTATGASVLEKFANYPEVDELLRLRANEQLFDTFVVRMYEWTQDSAGKWRPPFVQEDGRVHPIWKPTQISGRYGSEEPASSNWSMGDETNEDPRRRLPNIRRQLVAPPRRAIVAFDKAQLEARSMAVQSGDPFLCGIFRDGKDIHHEFGVIAFPKMGYLDKASEEYNHLRDTTKRVEYGAIYGGADATVHRAIAAEVPSLAGPRGFQMIREAIATMKKAVPGVFAWQQRLLYTTSQPPYTLRSFILGRRRVFPLGNPPPTDIANNPNQFFGADVMDLGLVEIMKRLEKYDDAFPILHQHDAIYFECWEDDAERLAKDVDEAFYIEVKGVSGDVIPFPNDLKIGYAYHVEPSDKQKAKYPQLVWNVGRPGLSKFKVKK